MLFVFKYHCKRTVARDSDRNLGACGGYIGYLVKRYCRTCKGYAIEFVTKEFLDCSENGHVPVNDGKWRGYFRK